MKRTDGERGVDAHLLALRWVIRSKEVLIKVDEGILVVGLVISDVEMLVDDLVNGADCEEFAQLIDYAG